MTDELPQFANPREAVAYLKALNPLVFPIILSLTRYQSGWRRGIEQALRMSGKSEFLGVEVVIPSTKPPLTVTINQGISGRRM